MFRLQADRGPLGVRLAEEVLRQIEEGGIANVRISVICDYLQIGVGKLYRNWGRREQILEHTWRTCIASVAYEIDLIMRRQVGDVHTVDWLWDHLVYGLPERIDAFFELHAARRRWVHFNQDFAFVVPGLVSYVEMCQRFGHFRAGPPHVLASLIWWFFVAALSGPMRNDPVRRAWTLHALRRMLLTPERLEEEELEAIEIDEVVPPEFSDVEEFKRKWSTSGS